MKIKTVLIILMSISTQIAVSPTTMPQRTLVLEDHFAQIKKDPKALRSFFWKMPKGGDIHHHFLGSVFAEDYLEMAMKDSLWINPDSYQLYFDQTDALSKNGQTALPINQFLTKDPTHRAELIDHWSVRNHKARGRDGHHWFFATFQKFLPAAAGNESQLLTELCRAASVENVQYLETMVEIPSILQRVAQLAENAEWDADLKTEDQLESLYGYFEENDIDQWAGYNAEVMDYWHKNTSKHGIHLKFQTAAFRIFPHLPTVFAHLCLAFQTASLSKNVIGVNFVAPEDHQVSLVNYRQHMAMIRFLKDKFPEVNLSLHAGELVNYKGDTRADDLEYHIDEALTVAGAQRIGHGVDLLSETRKNFVLNWMKEKDIAVEVNLESNEVILETTPETHPLSAYLTAEVPVCISSDDAAILRSDLTHQFELLVKYVPDISYQKVKELVKNSLSYSFLSAEEKAQQTRKLEKAFGNFEALILSK